MTEREQIIMALEASALNIVRDSYAEMKPEIAHALLCEAGALARAADKIKREYLQTEATDAKDQA